MPEDYTYFLERKANLDEIDSKIFQYLKRCKVPKTYGEVTCRFRCRGELSGLEISDSLDRMIDIGKITMTKDFRVKACRK